MIVGAFVVAMGLSFLRGMWRIGEVAVESPLFVVVYLAVIGVLYLTCRLFRGGRDRLRSRLVPVQPPPRPQLAVPRVRPARARRATTGESVLIAGVGIVVAGAGPFMVVKGWRSGFSGVALMIVGMSVTLFGILCLVGAAELVLTRRQRTTDARAESALDLLRCYTSRPDRRDVEGLRALLRDLSHADTAVSALLAELSTCPGLLDGLSFQARRGDLTRELQPFVDTVAAHVAASARPQTDLALAAALASLDRDGHTREAAVAAMAADPSPANAWFLAERCADPVEPVRLRALAALESLVLADPQTYAPVVHRAAARLGDRRWAGALRALAGAEPAGRSLTPCCWRGRDKLCFPVRRERLAAEEARADG